LAITFPVLRELKIEGYELFETANSSGLVHKFASGVHVIAGINGLGKTTLLNIIYRMLLGPKDMSKEDGGLASTQHILSDWRNKKYFRKRVRDEARGARAEAVISFGRRRIKVVRSLRTLEVESLCLDGVPEAQATQDR
jgi:recombinational DNA repair ATPase RecF